MGIDPKDTDVFQLLQKLKDANGTYPQELLAVRRQGYLKQVAEISAGAGLATALKTTVKNAKGTGAGLPPAASTLLETLLVVAIVAEAGAVTYFYRDKLVDLYNKITKSPKVEEVANPPVISSPVPDFQFTVTPVLTITVTETPIGTPSALAQQPTHQDGVQNSSGSPDISPAISTPAPNGNSGNQYGLTPRPVRTKEPGNNSTNNPDSQSDPKKKHK